MILGFLQCLSEIITCIHICNSPDPNLSGYTTSDCSFQSPLFCFKKIHSKKKKNEEKNRASIEWKEGWMYVCWFGEKKCKLFLYVLGWVSIDQNCFIFMLFSSIQLLNAAHALRTSKCLSSWCRKLRFIWDVFEPKVKYVRPSYCYILVPIQLLRAKFFFSAPFTFWNIPSSFAAHAILTTEGSFQRPGITSSKIGLFLHFYWEYAYHYHFIIYINKTMCGPHVSATNMWSAHGFDYISNGMIMICILPVIVKVQSKIVVLSQIAYWIICYILLHFNWIFQFQLQHTRRLFYPISRHFILDIRQKARTNKFSAKDIFLILVAWRGRRCYITTSTTRRTDNILFPKNTLLLP